MKILLVEDNETIILGLEYLLAEEGFRCDSARTRQEAEQKLLREQYDLCLLDISLPDGSGYDLCRLVQRERKLPVIFLTAREEERDVVKGFDLGADDYIVKPFRNRELISRMKNVLRRYGKASPVLVCAHIRMDTDSGKVFCHGEEVALTKLEYKILNVMMSRPGQLFTREEILANIWDISGNYVNDNTLSVTIKRLREKIQDKDGAILKTIRGMGYRLDAAERQERV